MSNSSPPAIIEFQADHDNSHHSLQSGNSYDPPIQQQPQPELRRHRGSRQHSIPVKCFKFITSVRFVLPAFVTIAMVLVATLTITLMSQNTQQALEDVVNTLQKTALRSVENEVGGAFRQVSATTLTCAKVLSMYPVPDVAISSNVSLQSYPFMNKFFNDITVQFLTNLYINAFFFVWPSGRMFAGSSELIVDINDEYYEIRPLLGPGILPNFTITPSAKIPIDFERNTTMPYKGEKVWNPSTFGGTRSFAVQYAVFDDTGILVGRVGGSTQLSTIHTYLQDILPTTNSLAVVYEPTGYILLLTSRTSLWQNTVGAVEQYFIWNETHNDVIRPCGGKVWDTRPLTPSIYLYTRCYAQGGDWYIGTKLIDGDGARLYVTILIPEDDVLGRVQQSTRTTIIICSVIAGVCIVMVVCGTLIIGNALKTLQRNLRNVAFMGIDEESGAKGSNDETSSMLLFSELRDTQESYVTLHNAIKAFHFYVPVNVVRGVLRGTMHSGLGMTQRFLVVSFQDIEKFTMLCEQNRSDPDKVIDIVSPMFEEVSRILTRNHGTIDKYIGDCIMTYWEVVSNEGSSRRSTLMGSSFNNSPRAGFVNSASSSGRGGVDDDMMRNASPREACQNAIRAAHESLFVEPVHGVRFRTGIHCGLALLGNFGSMHRFNYTAVGDTVNTAARVESLNKEFRSQALCSESVIQLIVKTDHDSFDQSRSLQSESEVNVIATSKESPFYPSPKSIFTDQTLLYTRYVGRVQVVGKDIALGMYQILRFPFNNSGERDAWDDLISKRLEKEHAFEAVNQALSEMIPEEQSDPTLEYLRGQVVSLQYLKESGITSYNGVWKQTNK